MDQTDSEHNGRRRFGHGLNMAVLPSLLTLGNLLCGFAAIFYASRDPLVEVMDHWTPLTVAAALIFMGMVFDALDGRVARMIRHTSGLGEHLDSMADMVTFGVAPAFLIIQLVGIGTPFFGSEQADQYFDRTVLLFAGIYVACCALRLARFNLELTQEDAEPITAEAESDRDEQPEWQKHLYFKGLPAPGAAGTVAGLVLLHQHLLTKSVESAANNSAATAPESPTATATAVGLVIITLMAAMGMVSSLPYVHVINRFLRDRAPFDYVVKAAVIILLLLLFPQWSLAMGFAIYAMSAPAVMGLALLRTNWRQPRRPAAPSVSASSIASTELDRLIDQSDDEPDDAGQAAGGSNASIDDTPARPPD